MRTLEAPARQALDAAFIEAFREFEACELARKDRLNALAGRAGLDGQLQVELRREEPALVARLDELGQRTQAMSAGQANAHLAMVQSSRLATALREAPFFRQILERPRGYPGDAEMMRFLYRNGFEGATPFGRLWHARACLAPTGAAVRNRKELLRRKILLRPGAAVLSLAAGPAQELREVLECSAADYSLFALDHDLETLRELDGVRDRRFRAALANAFRMIRGDDRIATPRPVGPLNGHSSRDFRGWRRLLAPLKYRFEHLRGRRFDLVYSAGLFDYLRARPDGREEAAQALTRFLFDLVAPGGELVIGNFNPSLPAWNRFCMDYLCNWQLVYRTDAELHTFADGIDARQIDELEIVKEPEGINSFLVLKKRADLG